MELTALETIVDTWSYWERDVPPSIRRDIPGFPDRLSPDLVHVIQGVRRCGKSTFLSQLLERLSIEKNCATFVNFEDPRLTNHLTTDLLDAILAIAQVRGAQGQQLFLFLDEVQNVLGWEKWLHLKTARPSNVHYVVTGSNSKLLSGELSTALTGRHITTELFPFNYNEYQRATDKRLSDYLENGGFPRVQSYENPKQLLREYFTDIVEKNVRQHMATKSNLTLQQLFQLIFESVGSELSLRKMAATLDTTPDTVGQYVDAGMAAYLIQAVPYFAYSEKKRLVRNRKFYAIDTGMRNAVTTRPGRDVGKNFENLVFLSIRRFTKEIYYWRNRGEVDFIVRTPNGVLPIQVSWDGVKQRHMDAIEEFKVLNPDALDAVYVTEESYEAFVGFISVLLTT